MIYKNTKYRSKSWGATCRRIIYIFGKTREFLTREKSHYFSILLKSTSSAEKCYHLEIHSCWCTLEAERKMKAIKKKLRWKSNWRFISTKGLRKNVQNYSLTEIHFSEKSLKCWWNFIKRKDLTLPKWHNITQCKLLSFVNGKRRDKNAEKLSGNKSHPWANRYYVCPLEQARFLSEALDYDMWVFISANSTALYHIYHWLHSNNRLYCH